MNKIALALSTAFWLVMMGLLVSYDVLPGYADDPDAGYDSLLRGIDAPVVREMVVYNGDQEVGTSQTNIIPAADGTYVISNVTSIDFQIGIIVTKVQAMLDINLDADKELDKLSLTVNVGGRRADVSGVRVNDTLHIKARLGNDEFEQNLPYENGIISSYFEPFSMGNRLRVGKTWHTKFLDPLSQRFTTAEVRVVEKEILTLALRAGEPPRPIETYKVVLDAGTTQLKAWATEDGVILKQETPLGYTLVYRESAPDDKPEKRL